MQYEAGSKPHAANVWIGSEYVPDATCMVSPGDAALIAACIVGWFNGTLIVAA